MEIDEKGIKDFFSNLNESQKKIDFEEFKKLVCM